MKSTAWPLVSSNLQVYGVFDHRVQCAEGWAFASSCPPFCFLAQSKTFLQSSCLLKYSSLITEHFVTLADETCLTYRPYHCFLRRQAYNNMEDVWVSECLIKQIGKCLPRAFFLHLILFTLIRLRPTVVKLPAL